MSAVILPLIRSVIIVLRPAVRLAIAFGVIVAMSVSMTTVTQAADITTIYNDSCATCHDKGVFTAIKKGDSAKWQQLIEQKGMPALIESVKNGTVQMPAGGLCASCSDAEYRQLIEKMAE